MDFSYTINNTLASLQPVKVLTILLLLLSNNSSMIFDAGEILWQNVCFLQQRFSLKLRLSLENYYKLEKQNIALFKLSIRFKY